MSTATEMVALYITAEKEILMGKEFTLSGRTLKRENLNEIIKGRNHWQTVVNSESAKAKGGSSLYSLVDFR
jgi:hypothetical protein